MCSRTTATSTAPSWIGWPRGIRPPGLHVLCRACEGERANFDARGLQIVPREVGGSQLLVASVPRTANAAWRPFGEGKLIVARAGCPLH
jgi:hypothetical protein